METKESTPISDIELFQRCVQSKRCSTLAEMGYWEARNQTDRGVAAVMYVVLNRAEHPTLWPSTISGVINQPYQFSYRDENNFKRGFTECNSYRRISIIARKVLDGEIQSPVGNSVYYYSTDIEPPNWSRRKKYVTEIGAHRFYSEKERH